MDRGRYKSQEVAGPFNFVHRQYLLELGVAREHSRRQRPDLQAVTTSHGDSKSTVAEDVSTVQIRTVTGRDGRQQPEAATCSLCGKDLAPPRVLREDGSIVHLACARAADEQMIPIWEAETAAREAERAKKLEIDVVALARFRPPHGATDDLLLTAKEAPSAVLRRSSHGTRIDPVAAQWLWDHRTRLEEWSAEHGVLTSYAWCTCCGRLFKDARVKGARFDKEGKRLRKGSRHRSVARWCPRCRNMPRRHLPQLRNCAAEDCDIWFQPSQRNQMFHRPNCRAAQHEKDRAKRM